MKSRKVLYTVGISGALGASLIIGGVVTSNVINGEGVPMAGEETIIQEIEQPVAQAPETVAEAPKEDVVEPEAPATTEPVAEPAAEPELKDDCEAITNYILREYGTLDFYEALSGLHGGLAKEQLEKLGLESWAQVKEFFGKNKHSVDTNLTYGDVKKLVDLEPAYKARCNS